MKRMKLHLTLLGLILLFLPLSIVGQPTEKIGKHEKCSVCGMLVAKYPQWVTQLQNGATTKFFDGVKDMMAYYLEPMKYGGNETTFTGVYVKDYYSQKWIDGTKAVYVTGSDVLGPMGHEFIPFSDQAAAESFSKDHKGKHIHQFDEITIDLVNTMKGHHKMMGKKMKKQE